MAVAAEALVTLPRSALPAPVDLRDALTRHSFDVEWQPFGPEVDELNAYVVPRGDASADAFVSISMHSLGEAEREDLLRRATAQLGAGAAPIAQADTLVRVSATPGNEFDWKGVFETLAAAIGTRPHAVTYLVNEDEYLGADDVVRRMEGAA